MSILRKIITFSIFTLLMAGLAIAPAQTQVAQAQAATVVYNLYATDGYVEMADGEAVYAYGFIGGRQGVPFTYQTSFCTGDGIERDCDAPTNVTEALGPPAPAGGPLTASEALLAGNAQFPAPVISAATGDVVEIRLKNLGIAANPNAPNDPHSIHLHGLDVDAANDGVPETSVGAVPANLCADGSTATAGSACDTPAPGAGNVVVYMFTPEYPGTYMYHCHQEADIHVNMGMYGALAVYNPGEAGAVSGPGSPGSLYGWAYDKDVVMLLSEFDIRGHADEEGTYVTDGLVEPNSWDPDPYNWAAYEPQYWFINGLSFPQTIHAGFPSGYTFGDWLAAHPGYDPLITGSVSRVNPAYGLKSPGEKVLIRVINMGFETQPMHMHGYHGKIIGSDQRAWDWANKPPTGKNPAKFGAGLEKNTLTIGSGETYEWLVDFGQQSFFSVYTPGTESCYDPVTNLPVANAAGCTPIPANGDPASGNNYIGGPEVRGLEGPTANYDAAGFGTSQYFPFHNHEDYKATNNGVYPGGMFTMLVPLP